MCLCYEDKGGLICFGGFKTMTAIEPLSVQVGSERTNDTPTA